MWGKCELHGWKGLNAVMEISDCLRVTKPPSGWRTYKQGSQDSAFSGTLPKTRLYNPCSEAFYPSSSSSMVSGLYLNL